MAALARGPRDVADRVRLLDRRQAGYGAHPGPAAGRVALAPERPAARLVAPRADPLLVGGAARRPAGTPGRRARERRPDADGVELVREQRLRGRARRHSRAPICRPHGATRHRARTRRVRGVCELLRRYRVVVPRRRLRGVERLRRERLLERLARSRPLQRPRHADDRPVHPQLRRANGARDEDGAPRPVRRRLGALRGDALRLSHGIQRNADAVAYRTGHAVPAGPAPALGGRALREVRSEPGSAGRDRGLHLGRGAGSRSVRDTGRRGRLGAALSVPDRAAHADDRHGHR